MAPSTPAHPDLIAVEDLFALPAHSKAVLSPDGTRIAYLAPWSDRLNVWVRDLGAVDGVDGEPRRVTADRTRNILSFAWTADSRWLLYAQDDGGDENFHLFRVEVTRPDRPVVDLTPYPGARVLKWDQPVARPGTVLLQINQRRVDEMDLAELDVATGELTVLAQNPGQVMDWSQPPTGGWSSRCWPLTARSSWRAGTTAPRRPSPSSPAAITSTDWSPGS
ncbi:TolB family protein [Pseudonocardia sp. HH130629-09]|uniref:TolB family protein n=1 Tax=Pseudonocardia sp. HH130629-09 TaxID=1641402 RepID=UPI001EE6F50C|nr:hypothetical protein [Pseudonocardia sp. HH130629-09]